MRLKSGFIPYLRSAKRSKDAAEEEWWMRQLRLLVIDDEPALADFVAQVATGCGYQPILTSDDRAFRDAFQAKRPDVVVLDLGMPGMDGVELLRFLAEEDNRAPVLIISGFDRRVLESAFRLGEALGLDMIGPLEKPVRLEALERLLTELKASLVR
jgi:DNA-binding response OmpR family regulator